MTVTFSVDGSFFKFRHLPASSDPVHFSFGATTFANATAVWSGATGLSAKSGPTWARAGSCINDTQSQIRTGYQECQNE